MTDDISIHEYVEAYEFRGDQDYTPNERERALIEDAIGGYLGLREATRAAPERAVEVGEMGRDDLRRRAKQMLIEKGVRKNDRFPAFGIIPLMVDLAIDAVRNPPDQCAYPECGCCPDTTCADAALTAAPVLALVPSTGAVKPVAWIIGWVRDGEDGRDRSSDRVVYNLDEIAHELAHPDRYEVKAVYDRPAHLPDPAAGEVVAVFGVAHKLATEIINLKWVGRDDWTVENQADAHGFLCEMIDRALYATPAREALAPSEEKP